MKTLLAWWKRWWNQLKRECVTCRFWLHVEGRFGECRRNPPIGDWDSETRWNTTADDDWCGCWKKNPNWCRVFLTNEIYKLKP